MYAQEGRMVELHNTGDKSGHDSDRRYRGAFCDEGKWMRLARDGIE